MINKHRIFGVFLVFLLNSYCQGIPIDEVRNKEVLDDKDFAVIEQFVAERIEDLIETTDFSKMARKRKAISLRSRSNKLINQVQYSSQFSESAYKHISRAFRTVADYESRNLKFKVSLNLLILLDSLGDLRLVDLSLNMINDKNKVIQYWAVRSITNNSIIKQLNSISIDNLTVGKKIVSGLKRSLGNVGQEALALIAEFGTKVKTQEAEQLLTQIADMRIKQYADWTVKDELLDITVLSNLCIKMSSTEGPKPHIARRFGQLYSYAIQKYIMDIKGGDFLNTTEKKHLVSVLGEIEKSCISGHLKIYQKSIRDAVGRGDYITLLAEHDKLLGDNTKAGELAEKLGFQYQGPSGVKRTAPLTLPARAMTRKVNKD